MHKGKILVVLSSYNGVEFIEEQVDSIMNQKEVDLDCQIRDDGSTDSIAEILNKLKSKYPERLNYSIGENVGFARSFYNLIESAEDYSYYAFSDQDDYWCDTKLKGCIDLIEDDNIPRLCFCNCMLVDKDLKPIKLMHNSKVDICDKIRNLFLNPAPGCTMVFNRAAKKYFLKADPLRVEFHDHWLLAICSFFGQVAYHSDANILYRQHGNNVVGGVSGVKSTWKHRLKILKQDTHDCEKIATELLNNFSTELQPDDIAILKQVSSYRKSVAKTLKLCFSKAIKRHLSGRKKWFIIRVLTRKL